MARLSLRPLIEPGSIHNDLIVRGIFHVCAVHRPRRGPFEVDALAVVSAPMAGALELVLARLPIRRAAQMSTASIDDKDTIGGAVDPDAVLLLPLRIHTQGVVRGVTDLENGRRLEQCAGKKETKKGDKPCAQKSSDRSPDQAPPALVDCTRLGTDGRQTGSRCCFGRTHGRRTHIPGCISATGSGCLRRFRLWFTRFGFRARHSLPPGLGAPRAMHQAQSKSYSSGEGAPPQNQSSKRNPKSAEEKFLAVPRSRNKPVDWRREEQGRSTSAESVRGPPDWRSLIRKHREALNISQDPPETKRILLKTKKFVNASLRCCPEMIKSDFRKTAS